MNIKKLCINYMERHRNDEGIIQLKEGMRELFTELKNMNLVLAEIKSQIKEFPILATRITVMESQLHSLEKRLENHVSDYEIEKRDRISSRNSMWITIVAGGFSIFASLGAVAYTDWNSKHNPTPKHQTQINNIK